MGNRERCVTVLRGVWRRVFGVYGVYGFGGDEEREREREKSVFLNKHACSNFQF